MKANRQLENANKITYLVKMYPTKPANELIELLQVPPIEVNAAIWLAQELGFLKEELEDDRMLIGTPPETYQFGEAEQALEANIIYCFKRIARDETDLDEKFLTDWLMGYPAQDALIAVNRLLEDRVLFEYELTDDNPKLGKSVYKFYTLFENSEMQWGKKNFKIEPTLTTDKDSEAAKGKK